MYIVLLVQIGVFLQNPAFQQMRLSDLHDPFRRHIGIEYPLWFNHQNGAGSTQTDTAGDKHLYLICEIKC